MSMGRRMRQDSAPHLPGCQGSSCSTSRKLLLDARDWAAPLAGDGELGRRLVIPSALAPARRLVEHLTRHLRVGILRKCWSGEKFTHRGEHYKSRLDTVREEG